MKKVFIGGSRRVSRLNAEARQRIDTMLSKDMPILVGDANGADKAVQKHLFDSQYRNVEVFCSNGECRNNIGGWPVRSVPVRSRERNANFYSEKDRVMAEEATVGFMLWDGRSVGTLLNVLRLLKLEKKAVLYVVPKKKFIDFHNTADWKDFISECETALRLKIKQRTESEPFAQGNASVQMSFLDPVSDR